MKKKVLLYGLVSLLAVAAGIFGMVSCNKDSGSGSGSVVGTWEGRDLTLIFNSDNTGVVIEKYSDYGYKASYTFTYTMKDANSGRIVGNGIDDEGVIVTFKIAGGNTMTLYGSYEDYEYDWVIDVLTRKGSDPSGGGGINLVGTWYGELGSAHMTLVFNANGSGSFEIFYRDYYSGDDYERGSFTYSMTDAQYGYLYVKDYYYGTERIRFRVVGNTMYVYDVDSSYEDEISWVLTKQR